MKEEVLIQQVRTQPLHKLTRQNAKHDTAIEGDRSVGAIGFKGRLNATNALYCIWLLSTQR
jgi:hypothetical protein